MRVATTIALITGPGEEPVTLDEAKSHLKVSSGDDDAYITALIAGARIQAEIFTRRAFLTQEFEQYMDSFPYAGFHPYRSAISYSDRARDYFIRLHNPRLQTVEFIKYIDQNGNPTTLDPANYTVDAVSEPARICPAFGKFWPPARLVPNAVTVHFKAGYGDTAAAAIEAEPKFQTVKQAILFLVAHWYSNREPYVYGQVVKLPDAFESLLWGHRVLEF